MAKTKRRRRKVEEEVEDVEDAFEVPVCAAPGCPSPALAEGEFCFVHLGLDLALDKLNKSMRKNDVTGALMGGLGLLFFNPQINGAIAARVADAAAPRPGASPPPPPPRPPRQNPWELLGLDPRRATATDVKRVQRTLAKLYHADAGATGVDPARMAAVNAAAAACLAELAQHGK